MTESPGGGYLARQLATYLRDARTVSRRAKAAELDVAPNTLRELELGLANPTLQRVEEIAEQYGLTLTLTATANPERTPA